jgi:hypothetical protein
MTLAAGPDNATHGRAVLIARRAEARACGLPGQGGARLSGQGMRHSHRECGTPPRSMFRERHSGDKNGEYFCSRSVKIRPKYHSPFPVVPRSVITRTSVTMYAQDGGGSFAEWKITAPELLRCARQRSAVTEQRCRSGSPLFVSEKKLQ